MKQTVNSFTYDNIRVIQRMRIACCITKATDIDADRIIITAFPRNSSYANALHC